MIVTNDRQGVGRTNGFTVVELLIAIIVIAILATITIVVYTGITNRAQASRAALIGTTYSKGLKLYYAKKGVLPGGGFVDDFAGGCFGVAADYPATADFPAGACYKSTLASGGTPYYYYVDSQLGSDLQAVMTIPSASTTLVRTNSGTGAYVYNMVYRGMFYYFYRRPSYDDVFQIFYHIKGNVPCASDLWSRSVENDKSSTECALTVDLTSS